MGLRKNTGRSTSAIIDIDVDSRVGIPLFVAGIFIAFFPELGLDFLFHLA
jgi:hypothetical protein